MRIISFVISLMFFCTTNTSLAQGIFYWTPSDSKLYFREVVHLTTESSGTGTTNDRLPTLSVNMSENNFAKPNAAIFRFDKTGTVSIAKKISSTEGNVSLVRHLSLSNNSYMLFGNITDDFGAIKKPFLAKVNLITHAVKMYDLATHSSFKYRAVDMKISGKTVFLLYGGNTGSDEEKIGFSTVDTTDIRSTFLYVPLINKPLISLIPHSIEATANGGMLIGGSIKRDTENLARPILMDIKFKNATYTTSGKIIYLLSEDQSFNFRSQPLQVAKNSNRYFGITQTIIGPSDPGQVYSMMFDTSTLNLLTWRNYTMPIRLESAKMDGGNFLLSGQAPVTNGYSGYSMVSINGTNAIVEKLNYYPNYLPNSSIATNSAIAFDRFSGEIIQCAKPNNIEENTMVMIWRNDTQKSQSCDSALTSSVFKTPISLEDYPMSSVTGIPIYNSCTLKIEDFEVNTLSKCLIVNNKEIVSQEIIELFPNPNSGSFTIKGVEQVERITIYHSCGHLILNQQKPEAVIDIAPVEAGIYFAEITLNTGQKITKKIVMD